MKKNKKPMIVISIILALCIIALIVICIFLFTDTFKTNKQLFSKYFGQNEDVLNEISNLKITETYKNLKNENQYTSNTNIKVTHSEGGEVSNPINNLSGQIRIQKDSETQYKYLNAELLYNDESYLGIEAIQEQDLYGARFPGIKQFVSVKDDETIYSVENNLIENEYEINLFEKITGENLIENDVKLLNYLKDKYKDIIVAKLLEGTFSKQKDAVITYNNVATKTNAYTLDLNSQQVQNMIVEVLNNLYNDTETIKSLQLPITEEQCRKTIDDIIKYFKDEYDAPEIKLTVYERKQQTIRTILEVGGYKVTIENTKQNGTIVTNIKYINEETNTEYDVQISKKSENENEEFGIVFGIIENGVKQETSFLDKAKYTDGRIENVVEIKYTQNITDIVLTIEDKINLGGNFTKAQTLDSSNNVILNNLSSGKQKELVALLQKQVPEKIQDQINQIIEKIVTSNAGEENPEEGNQMSQTEINRFNAKFEFYTGDGVSTENVKNLLSIVKDNLENYQITEVEDQQNSNNKKVNIRIDIEKDKVDEEGINKILENIQDNKKYKISIFYNEANGLISYITIAQV